MRKVFWIIALLSLLTVRADATTVPATTRVTVGAVEQYALVKASTTAGRVTVLLSSDPAYLVTGVALTSSAGTGNTIQVMEVQGVQTKLKSDGTTVIAVGDAIQPSTTVSGRVMKGTSGVVCSAMSAAAATPGTVFNCL